MKARLFRKLVAAPTLLTFLTVQQAAVAYNPFTHQSIVNHAWQSMRSATTPNLAGQIQWITPPAVIPNPASPDACVQFPASSPQNPCGVQLTGPNDPRWLAYLQEIRDARQRLNQVRPELPRPSANDPNCAQAGFPNVTRVGDWAQPVGPDYFNGHDKDEVDDEDEDIANACLLRDPKQKGVFADLVVPDDERNMQGFVYGWHAEHRDDAFGDTQFDIMPFFIGQYLELLGGLYELIFGALFLPFVCLYDLFAGGNCSDHARRLADQTNPADVLKGLLPGWKYKSDEDTVGVWHHINVQPGMSNWYDDRQGLFFQESGPFLFGPSGVDSAIALAADIAFINLDASESRGTSRYEITDDETSFSNPSRNRANWSWQSETIGHVQFSPIDNFALFGHDRYRKDSLAAKRAGGLGWPLHAIGDVTVPMHVVATSGWGHRPYEDFVNNAWDELMFERRDPFTSGTTADSLKVQQLLQAQRVLMRGFFWNEFLKTHADVRDFITELASETLERAFDLSTTREESIWCDGCSVGYIAAHGGFFDDLQAVVAGGLTDQISIDGLLNPEGFYREKEEVFQFARESLEHSSAASLAYLLRVARDSAGICTEVGQSCTSTSTCCGSGSACSGGVCRRAAGAGCYNSAQCINNSCTNNHCCTSARLGVACNVDGECCGNTCQSGTCCTPATFACSSNSDCCSGGCQQGVCASPPPPSGGGGTGSSGGGGTGSSGGAGGTGGEPR